MSRDAKIGLLCLFVAAVLLLVRSLQSVGVVVFGSQLGLLFSQVHGLRAGDLVTIGGVPMGRVLSIDFAPKEIQERLAPLTGGVTLVRAQVVFDEFRRIPQNSTYTVRSDLNGFRRIEITLSPSEEDIGPDELFFSEEAPRQDDQLKATVGAFSKLGQQTERLRQVLSDPDFSLHTKDSASNLRFYSRELKAASSQAPEQLEALEESLNQQEVALLGKLDAIDEKTRAVRERMIELSPQLSENLKGWSERILRQGNKFTQVLTFAVTRSTEYEELIRRVASDRLDPQAVRALVITIKKWSRKLEEYRALAEDLHALTSDPTVRSDLMALITKLKEKSLSLRKQVEKLESRVDHLPVKSILGYPDDENDRIPGTLGPEGSPSPQGLVIPANGEGSPRLPEVVASPSSASSEDRHSL